MWDIFISFGWQRERITKRKEKKEKYWECSILEKYATLPIQYDLRGDLYTKEDVEYDLRKKLSGWGGARSRTGKHGCMQIEIKKEKKRNLKSQEMKEI